MKPAAFEYLAPRTIPEALSALARHGAEAKVLAGGQSLVPLMNFRLARPAFLVDINGIAELSGIERRDGHVSIGAMTRQRDAATDAFVRDQCPLVADAIALVGHVAIQNRGTIGGSLAHADPAAELPVAALALDARMHLQSLRGERSIPADAFFTGYLSTVVEPDELLTTVSMCVPPVGSGWCFTEIARRHGDFALVAVATVLSLDDAGRICAVRISVGGAGPTPVRAEHAEQLLMGESSSEDLFRAAADTLGPELEPADDIHASADYRRHLAGVLVRRALSVARARHA